MSRSMLLLHRWVGLVVGAMILVAALTAIALNHQDQLLKPTTGSAATSPYARYMLSVVADPAHPERLLAGKESSQDIEAAIAELAGRHRGDAGLAGLLGRIKESGCGETYELA